MIVTSNLNRSWDLLSYFYCLLELHTLERGRTGKIMYRVSGIFFPLQIVEVEMPFDKTKNQRKGFCFITFESEQVVQELLKSPKQSINGKEVMFVLLDNVS